MPRLLAATVALPLALLMVGAAGAQEGALDVRIREVSFATGNETRLIVSVSGPAVPEAGLPPQSFSVTEQGLPVEGLRVEELFRDGVQVQQVALSLLMDVSRSIIQDLDDAKLAATEFIDSLPPTVRLNLITFGFNLEVVRDFVTLGAPGSPVRTDLAAAIDGLAVDEQVGTKLNDAVLMATDALARQPGAQHNIVVFSDGRDSGSSASLDDAVAAIEATNSATTSVLLSATRIAEEPLLALTEAVRGGTFVRVEDTVALREAFARVGQAIASQYVLTYTATGLEPDLTIAVAVEAAGLTVEDTVAALNQRQAVDTPTTGRRRGPLIPALASSTGLYLGIFAVFAALLLFIGMLFYAPAGRKAERLLARGLRMYTRGGKDKEKRQRDAGVLSGSSVGRAAVGFADRLPRPKQYDEKMQLQLDQAGWPLRSTEFILLQVGATVVGAVLGFVLFRSVVLGLILTVLGAVVPRLVLTNTIQRREAAFLEQLPDTLQLLSGSLQAGYGFLQAIDTVSKESNPPTSVEFSRVLAEARLGMPMDEALESMAERLGSEDFKWVVLAINIQRQVGGNLAQLLTTISGTLREREQVRRQIKVLSAEGRLSAIILSVLPFALLGYLATVNPDYLSELTNATIGRIAIVAGLVLMGIGIVWMSKIIKIDV